MAKRDKDSLFPKPLRSRRIVPRERLFARIDQAFQGAGSVWVAAEAGSGKTTLLASYLEERGLSGIRYRVSAADVDVPTFFHYFGEALQRASPRVPRQLPALTPEYLPKVALFARRFFALALGGLEPPFIIVFDELQGPALNAGLSDVLVPLLEDLPHGVRIAVLSRNAPSPAFARLVANSTMTLVGGEELRFDEEEAVAVAESLGCEDRKVAAQCVEQARGWAAGLVLLLQAHAKGPATHLPAQRVLFDYFAVELLDRSPSELRDFLLKTALLPAMSADEASTVSGNGSAGLLLERLVRENAFVYQDATRAKFEYHPLLREFLELKAEAEFPAETLGTVRRRAGKVLAASGRHEAAAEMYRKSRDWASLTALVLEAAPALIGAGRGKPVQEWISALPPQQVESSSDLLYWQGLSCLPFEAAAARASLARSYERAMAHGEPERALLACCGVLEAYGSEMGDFRGAADWVDRLDALLPDIPDDLSPHVEMRLAFAMEAVKWSRPQHALMKRWIERARKRIAVAPPPLALAYAYAVVYYDAWLGEHQRCQGLIPVGRRYARTEQAPPLLRCAWLAVEMCCHCFVGDLDAAREAADRIARISEKFGLVMAAGMFRSACAYIGLCSGDVGEALEAIEKAAAEVDIERRTQACHWYYLRSQVALANGDLDKALLYGRTGIDWMKSMWVPFPLALHRLTFAQVLIEHAEYEEAEGMTQEARRFALELGSAGLAWHADLNAAYLRLHRGDRSGARPYLSSALAAARDKGAVVWDISMPARMAARLAEAALEAGIEVDYVREVIQRRRLPPQSENVEGWPWPVRIHSLGRFAIASKLPNGPRKAGHTPLALLKTLLALGGRRVDAGAITKILWPGAEPEDAENSFKVTLHRLRRLLGHDDALELRDNRLSLNGKVCWWDADAFERLVARCADLDTSEPTSEFERLAVDAMALYRGPFLDPGEDVHGAGARRERLRQQFHGHVVRLGEYYERRARWQDAERIYRKALEVEALSEVFYRQLIRCLKNLGRDAEALDMYYRCRDVLKAELGTTPSADTRALLDLAKSG